jgi:thiol:disulfide interchange protein DsbD
MGIVDGGMCMRVLRMMAMVAGMLCAAGMARAADSDVAADVVANVSSVQGGRGFLVGLRMKTHEGWHVYWKNSGDAGIATEVKWSVSPGWDVEPLEMPVPERFVAAGNIVSYGYSGEVVLLARLVPTKTAAPVKEAVVTADASWLCCKEACVPGNKKVSLTVPVGEGMKTNEALFAKWEAAVPSKEAPAGVKVEASAVKGALKGDAQVTMHVVSEQKRSLAFYPASDKVQITGGTARRGEVNGSDDIFTVHMMASQKDPAHVPFLVSYEEQGEQRGFFVNVDLSAVSAGK